MNDIGDLPAVSEKELSVSEQVTQNLLENFDCQPVLFVGSGLARRYIDAPDWEGALRMILNALPKESPSFEYLLQKYGSNLISIGTHIGELVFEWAWKDGRDKFPEELFNKEDKAIFLKHMLADILSSQTPNDVASHNPAYEDEFLALKAIRPHALITTNYDNMLENIFPGYEAIVGKKVLRYNLNAYGEVYHIHGSVDEPSTIVINNSDYAQWHKDSKYFAAKLLTYFVEHPVIILGYSLTDPNVRTVLEDIGAIVADETGLIANVLQVIYEEDLEGEAIQTEIAIPVNGSQFRITAIKTNSLKPVLEALSARHELKDVNTALVRALAARAMKLTRQDIPNGNIQVNYKTLEGIVDQEDALPTLLGITQANDVNKSHPFTLSSVGEALGYSGWNGAQKLIEKIKNDKGIDIKSFDSKYHCAVKIGKKDSSVSRKYSQSMIELLNKVKNGEDYKID